jgi:hypothetical protein
VQTLLVRGGAGNGRVLLEHSIEIEGRVRR